jgi:signal transduction histidine kinase
MLQRLRERMVPALEAMLRASRDREDMSRSLRTSRDELRVLAEEQAALRRVATLVARGVLPAEVFAAVATETARLLDADATRLMRYESTGSAIVMAELNRPGFTRLLGRCLVFEGGVTEIVFRTSRPARVDTYEGRPGALAALDRAEGLRSSVGAPILVEGRLWGALVVFWSRPEPPPPDAEWRLAQFTELVATAVANVESRAELNASRARIVVASDGARRRIERDLHDGVQQRLVSLGLELRAAEALVPAGFDELKARLSHTTDGLGGVFHDLQEISRGIHPAILSQGGLGPALKTLARRCPVPVNINSSVRRRLPERVEVAAYYVVSEALANTTKHAHASAIDIDVDLGIDSEAEPKFLVLSVCDDGIGGADPGLGSGLVGIADRVEALGGQVQIASPVGGGTSLRISLPVAND